MPTVAQGSAPVPNRSRCHVALWQEVTAQPIGDLAGMGSGQSFPLPVERGLLAQKQILGDQRAVGMCGFFSRNGAIHKGDSRGL